MATTLEELRTQHPQQAQIDAESARMLKEGMMDKDVLATLGATVTKVAVEYNRKVGDGNFGSIGASMTVEVGIAAGADPDAAANALYEFCKAAVARNLKPEAVAARESAGHPTVAPQGTAVTPVPPTVASPTVPAPGTPESSDIELVTLDAPTCAHTVEQGSDRLKVFGGKWHVWGVSVYPEVLATYPQFKGWETWPICKVGGKGAEQGNRFALPGGFQKVEIEMNKETGKPIRVHAFK